MLPLLQEIKKDVSLSCALYLNYSFLFALEDKNAGMRPHISSLAKANRIYGLSGIPHEAFLGIRDIVSTKNAHEEYNTKLSTDYFSSQPKGLYYPGIYNSSIQVKSWISHKIQTIFIDHKHMLENNYSLSSCTKFHSFSMGDSQLLAVPYSNDLVRDENDNIRENADILARIKDLAAAQEDSVVTLHFEFNSATKMLSIEQFRELVACIKEHPDLQLRNPAELFAESLASLKSLPSLYLSAPSRSYRMKWLEMHLNANNKEQIKTDLKEAYPGSELQAIVASYEGRKMLKDFLLLSQLPKKTKAKASARFETNLNNLSKHSFYWYAPNGGIYNSTLRHEFYDQFCALLMKILKENNTKKTHRSLDNAIVPNSKQYLARLDAMGGALTQLLDLKLHLNYACTHQNYPELYNEEPQKVSMDRSYFQDIIVDGDYDLERGILASDGHGASHSFASQPYEKGKKPHTFHLDDPKIKLNEKNYAWEINKEYHFEEHHIDAKYHFQNKTPKSIQNIYLGMQHAISLPDYSQESCQLYVHDHENSQFSIDLSKNIQVYHNVCALEMNLTKQKNRHPSIRKKFFKWSVPMTLVIENIFSTYYNINSKNMIQEQQGFLITALSRQSDLYSGDELRLGIQIQLA